jgi:voltage-gated potassium channel
MEFTYQFVRMMGIGLFYATPILLFLIALIAMLGQAIGRREGWSRSDALYYAFITATTVGYGDFRPEAKAGKFMAIGIALLGLLLTGIVVAIGVKAANLAFQEIYEITVMPR